VSGPAAVRPGWIALALVALVAFGAYYRARPVQRSPGVLAPEVPLQEAAGADAAKLVRDGLSITPLARFELTARVLSRDDYRFDAGADIAPTDLALGWGRMSDSRVVDEIEVTQGMRWYRWNTSTWPLSRAEIEQSSANMHIIPANPGVSDALERVRTGSVVALRGYLVEVHRPVDGYRWRSSLSRTDTGQGACELIWVESLQVR
jgi:hypothetical protein